MKIKNIFISYSFSDRKKFENLHKKLKNNFKDNFEIELYSFVFDNHQSFSNNKEMMTKALNKINKTDMLIAETSFKKIGIGLEVGYAKALNKKIIYIHKNGTEISNTVEGVSDINIEYKNIDDLLKKINIFLVKNKNE